MKQFISTCFCVFVLLLSEEEEGTIVVLIPGLLPRGSMGTKLVANCFAYNFILVVIEVTLLTMSV